MAETGSLAGLTVVEMTVHHAGLFRFALLADLGAEVIKIERPGAGDPTRTQGTGPEGKSAYFMALNRNKKSVTIDLKTDRAGRLPESCWPTRTSSSRTSATASQTGSASDTRPCAS